MTALLQFQDWWRRAGGRKANAAVVKGELAILQGKIITAFLERGYALDTARLPHIDLRGDEQAYRQLDGSHVVVSDCGNWVVQRVGGRGTAVMLTCGRTGTVTATGAARHMTMAFVTATPDFQHAWPIIQNVLGLLSAIGPPSLVATDTAT